MIHKEGCTKYLFSKLNQVKALKLALKLTAQNQTSLPNILPPDQVEESFKLSYIKMY